MARLKETYLAEDQLDYRVKTTGSTVATTIAVDDTLNGRAYKGTGGTASGQDAGNQVFLITSGGVASKFQISTGNTAYVDATVSQALGATGKFLGNITGAESGSEGVNSQATARAYFDADPTRYNASNTYYFFHSGNLRSVTYTDDAIRRVHANKGLAATISAKAEAGKEKNRPVAKQTHAANQVVVGAITSVGKNGCNVVKKRRFVLQATGTPADADIGKTVISTTTEGKVTKSTANAKKGEIVIIGYDNDTETDGIGHHYLCECM